MEPPGTAVAVRRPRPYAPTSFASRTRIRQQHRATSSRWTRSISGRSPASSSSASPPAMWSPAGMSWRCTLRTLPPQRPASTTRSRPGCLSLCAPSRWTGAPSSRRSSSAPAMSAAFASSCSLLGRPSSTHPHGGVLPGLGPHVDHLSDQPTAPGLEGVYNTVRPYQALGVSDATAVPARAGAGQQRVVDVSPMYWTRTKG